MFRLTRHGLREMIVGTIVLALLAAGLGWIKWPLGLIVLPVWIWLLAFFRDPERAVPGEQHLMVSPADGKVTDIIQIENCDLVGGPAVRVGIFLSVFNVHVNLCAVRRQSDFRGLQERQVHQRDELVPRLGTE